MSRLINIIGQIIHLAKIAKKQTQKGKYSSAKRLIKIILNFEEEEIKFIENESGSKEFYSECLSIFKDTKTSLKDLSEWNKDEVNRMLDRIIKLEEHQLSEVVKGKEGLSGEILEKIDPYIRDLVNEINKLSFVKQTTDSCSGHYPGRFDLNGAYISIEYDFSSPTAHNIMLFHKEMQKICPDSGVFRPKKPELRNPRNYELLTLPHRGYINVRNRVVYYLTDTSTIWKGLTNTFLARKKNLKRNLINRWNKIFKLVKKYEDIDSLEYKKQSMHIEANPKSLHKDQGIPGPSL